MHQRFQQRLDLLGRQEASEDDRYGGMLNSIGLLQSQLDRVGLSVGRARIAPLSAAVGSARIIVEMVVGGDRSAQQLLPSAVAGLLHVRAVILEMIEEMREARPAISSSSAP